MTVLRNNSGNALATAASIILGGAAAIYVVKNVSAIRDLVARPAQVVEQQPIMEPEPPVMWQEIPRKTPPKAPTQRPVAATPPAPAPDLSPAPDPLPRPGPAPQATKPQQVVTAAPVPKPVKPVTPVLQARSPWIEQMDGIFARMPSMRNQYDALREPTLPVFKIID